MNKDKDMTSFYIFITMILIAAICALIGIEVYAHIIFLTRPIEEVPKWILWIIFAKK